MAGFENLLLAHVYSFDEEAVRNEREDDIKYDGDEFDEKEFEKNYRGIDPEIIASLLDNVGARGDSPLMATALFHAGIEKPTPSFWDLYGKYDMYLKCGSDALMLFGVYLEGDGLRRDCTPDALLLALGVNRKPYRGYELIMTDLWINPESPQAVNKERELRDEAQIVMLDGDMNSNFLFAEQGTVIREMGEATGKTVETLGIQPEDYDGCEPVTAQFDRMARIDDYLYPKHEYYQLLKNLQELYATLKPDVEAFGGEGEELYELRLNKSEIAALNKLQGFVGTDQITGISIDREDRPKGECWYRSDDDVDPFYTNGWGDMTVIVNVEREGVATAYTFTIFMEGPGATFLRKRTGEVEEFSDQISKDAAHLLSLEQDPLDVATKVNEIDEFEYESFFKLIRNVQAVTTLT